MSGDDAGEVRGAAGSGDDDLDAASGGLAGVVGGAVGGAVGGGYVDFVGDAEFFEGFPASRMISRSESLPMTMDTNIVLI